MLNEKQREIFNQLLDVNYEMNHTEDSDRKSELFKQVCELKNSLKKDMGEELYARFMNMGSKMFAPKKQLLSDSFSEGIHTNTAAEKHLGRL